ncbi:MAG: rnr [Bacteroidetes bacterium]|nr:rnr [Bacteroidota bacterium]
MPKGNSKGGGKSQFIPRKKKEGPHKPAPLHTSKNKYQGAKDKPKRGIQDLVFETVKSMGVNATVQSVFSVLLGKLTNEQVITSLNRLESQGMLKVLPKGKIMIEGSRFGGGFGGDERKSKFSDKGGLKGILVTGKIDVTKSGAGYLLVDGAPRESKDIFIPPKFINHAMNGDHVQVRMLSSSKNRPEGQVTKIIKRAQESFAGTFEMNEGFGLVKTDEGSIRTKLWIASDRYNGAQDGDRVIARILYWNEKGKHPMAEIEEIINDKTRNDLDMKMILIQSGFHTEFPLDAVAELNKIPDLIPPAEIKDRLDYRDILTFTIDPADAKDFDDAISFRILENGNYEVGVHIADVSHYLKQGSELDKEAERRATSVYLPDRVCPMLPERLSNFLCSLRPNEDKLTFSTIFEFDKHYKVLNTTIGKTVIHSRRRFSYEDVQDVIETGQGDHVKEIHILDKIAKHIRAARFKNGAIAFEKDEVRFTLDIAGKPIGIYLKTRKDAHLMIEDFMLLSNETIARYGAKLKNSATPYPFVYRTHDAPDPSKLEQLSTIASRFGYGIKFEDPKATANTLNNMLKKIEGRPEQNLLENLAIRSMAKAEYTTKNIGHYGLAMDYYTHFTSPIRRYPDVLVHRLVYEELTGRPHTLSVEDLQAACRNSSLMERKAMEAEREATKYKQVEFLEDKVGEEFDGIVTGVIARGIFVEMTENKCEGMVALDDMGDDDFIFDESNIRLKARRSGKVYDIGQKVRVKLKRTNLEERKIDLALVDGE